MFGKYEQLELLLNEIPFRTNCINSITVRALTSEFLRITLLLINCEMSGGKRNELGGSEFSIIFNLICNH